MAMLDADMQSLVRRTILCFAATRLLTAVSVNRDEGRP